MAKASGEGRLSTFEQFSAGGVAFRPGGKSFEIAIIRVAPENRWQLPKGIIDAGETAEAAALREVREEAGITCDVIEPLDKIEYWFVASYDGTRRRYHKFVHFFLMKYLDGSVSDHDHEVVEARWAPINEAQKMLAFAEEKRIVRLAESRLGEGLS